MTAMRRAAMVLCALACAPAVAHAQDRSNAPFTLQQIVALLEGGLSGEAILPRIREACISFRMTDSNEDVLQQAGADAQFLAGLRTACNRAPAGAASTAAQPSRERERGYVRIEGALPPGWERKVNELPSSTNREIDLTPGRPAVILVGAPGWCPARLEVTMEPGEVRSWTPELRARSWVGGC